MSGWNINRSVYVLVIRLAEHPEKLLDYVCVVDAHHMWKLKPSISKIHKNSNSEVLVQKNGAVCSIMGCSSMKQSANLFSGCSFQVIPQMFSLLDFVISLNTWQCCWVDWPGWSLMLRTSGSAWVLFLFSHSPNYGRKIKNSGKQNPCGWKTHTWKRKASESAFIWE